MSVQINQYIMWGFKLDKTHALFKTISDNYEKYEVFMKDSAYDNKMNHHDGIFCLYDGMDGKYMVIGRVLQKSSDGNYLFSPPICGDDLELTKLEKEFILNSIQRNFGINPECKFWYITHYS